MFPVAIHLINRMKLERSGLWIGLGSEQHGIKGHTIALSGRIHR